MNDGNNPYSPPTSPTHGELPPDARNGLASGWSSLFVTLILVGVLWLTLQSNPLGGLYAVGLSVVIFAIAEFQTRTLSRHVFVFTVVLLPSALTCVFAALVWQFRVLPEKQWFHFWFPLFIANLTSCPFALSTLAMPPYHPKYVAAWALPITTINLVFWGTHMAATFMPNP